MMKRSKFSTYIDSGLPNFKFTWKRSNRQIENQNRNGADNAKQRRSFSLLDAFPLLIMPNHNLPTALDMTLINRPHIRPVIR